MGRWLHHWLPETFDWRAGEDGNKEDAEAPGNTEGADAPEEARERLGGEDAMIEEQDRDAGGRQGD